MKKLLFLIFCVLISFSSYSQKNYWEKSTKENLSPIQRVQRTTIPVEYEVFTLDLQNFKAELLKAPKRESSQLLSNVIVNFPNAEGEFESFRIYEASIMHPDLQAQFPDIKSYVGVGLGNKSAMVRFSTTLFGVHAMLFAADREVHYIDTYTSDLRQYMVYSRKNILPSSAFTCLVEDEIMEEVEGIHFSPRNSNTISSNTGIFRTYRLALASTVEYSQYHINQAGLAGGTVAQKNAVVLAAMNVTMTRVNGVYERDMSLTMQIVPTNTNIIFFTPEKPDTLDNNNTGNALLNQIQGVIDTGIGFNNYDIGHVFSTGGGGVASLGSPCTANKARGVTGSFAPVGDPFDIDFVAHEMGHQFGATHTQNNSCQRTAATAIEPGSASTIMGYAGICAPNVQNNSDAYFHVASLLQMDNFVAGTGNCSANINNNNDAPIIQPIQNYTIPRSTAFVLEGNATDANGDALTYCWEQTDTGIAIQPPTATDAANGPRFRSRNPSTSPNRFMPIMSTILTGATANQWEVVPSIAKTMNFSLLVRDNGFPNGGQTARTTMTVTTVANAGPFLVTTPNTNVAWVAGSNQTVSWDVAGTTANGVDTPYVDIYLSTNGGASFPTLLASKVPNDGSEIITVPGSIGNSNRIMVKGHNNIFLDVSNTNFSITAPVSTMAIAFNGVEGEQNKSVCQGSNAVYNLAYQTFAGFTGTTTFSATGNPFGTTVSFVPASASAQGTVQMQVTTNALTPIGIHAITVTATSGATIKTVNMYLEVVSGNFSLVTLNSPANAAVVEPSGVSFTWTADPNATLYSVQIASDASFTTIVEANVVSTNSYIASNLPNATTLYWRVSPGNESCLGVFSSVFSFSTTFCGTAISTNVPVVIPAAGTPTVNSTLTIPAGDNVVIQKVTVTVNIAHTWINDLIVTLISPTGTQVQLMNRECNPNQGIPNAIATFDDNGIVLVCGTNPGVSGVILPEQPLSALNGQNSQGVWTLRVQDVFNQDGGAINSWSIAICSENAPASVGDVTPLNFGLYPNPTKGNFTVQLDQVQSEKVGITVYDMRGRTIFDQFFSNNGAFNQEIQLASPQIGVYLVKVSDGNSTETKRLIIE
ncbi:reprolysin-like metallopeptidase [Flavobacterium lacus]|uniref:Putative secreted protein (Por secretion system target) n=1 Tax=Flavobacterium lacus TaxID=1353778 RepID=A0A328WVR6_9FLAO|nr:zinc-dependent metalloprotease family protein [Flavobacterium lacus]RAR50460.1 putative secreted protein (Por secretion system target) [Flavobacterium lacus]